MAIFRRGKKAHRVAPVWVPAKTPEQELREQREKEEAQRLAKKGIALGRHGTLKGVPVHSVAFGWL